jgi:HCOMODA/2-hydroxy-3-carboxy-muconic semialdehyde decarboxylase
MAIKQVVYRAIYAELNARLQSEALRLGPVNYLSAEEAARAMRANDAVIDRPWNLWKSIARSLRSIRR